jgi:O-antigen/teichoic acid export membrane protein
MSLKRNVIANLFGTAWSTLLSLALTPVYVRVLGIESFGLVGLFAAMQAVFAILDAGLGVTLSRGLARLDGAVESVQRRANLLRTLETVYWCVALVVVAVPLAAAGPIAHAWVHSEHLSPRTVQIAIQLMGLLAAAQLLAGFYQAGLIGLQRQLALNFINITIGTLRGVGALLVITFFSGGIVGFFIWYTVIGVVNAGASAAYLWRLVGFHRRARRDWPLLRAERRFTSFIAVNAIVGVCLTQADKVILSGIVPLSSLGYYSLAGTAAAAIWMIIVPVSSAVFPKLASLWERGDDRALADVYHASSQLMAVLLLPVAVTLCVFPREVMFAWTGNGITASETALIVPLLAGGNAFHGLQLIGGQLQLASGWSEMTFYTNVVSAIVLLPGLYFMARSFGPPGAAALWLVLNAGHFFTMLIMHRRLLPGELGRWWTWSIVSPGVVCGTVAYGARHFMPSGLSRLAIVVYVSATAIVLFIAVAAAVPAGRREARNLLGRWLGHGSDAGAA